MYNQVYFRFNQVYFRFNQVYFRLNQVYFSYDQLNQACSINLQLALTLADDKSQSIGVIGVQAVEECRHCELPVPMLHETEQCERAAGIPGKLNRHHENSTARQALRPRIRHTLRLIQPVILLVEDDKVVVLPSACQVPGCEDKDIGKKRHKHMECNSLRQLPLPRPQFQTEDAIEKKFNLQLSRVRILVGHGNFSVLFHPTSLTFKFSVS